MKCWCSVNLILIICERPFELKDVFILFYCFFLQPTIEMWDSSVCIPTLASCLLVGLPSVPAVKVETGDMSVGGNHERAQAQDVDKAENEENNAGERGDGMWSSHYIFLRHVMYLDYRTRKWINVPWQWEGSVGLHTILL